MQIDELNEKLKDAVLKSGLARFRTVHIFPLLELDESYQWCVDCGANLVQKKTIHKKDMSFMDNIVSSLHNKLNGIYRNLEMSPGFKIGRRSDFEAKPLVFEGYKAVPTKTETVRVEDPIKRSVVKKTIQYYKWETE